MTKRRMIHSCLWASEDVGALDITQRLLWIGLITTADDQGRGRAHPGLVRSALFPFDDIDLATIETGLQAIEQLGLVILYKADGKAIYQVVKWWEYQRPQWAYPSEFTAPDGWADKMRYRKNNAICTENWASKPLAKPLPKDLPKPLLKDLPKPLPKDTPKPLAEPLVYDHSISTSNSISTNNKKGKGKGAKNAPPSANADLLALLALWSELFPSKPQPRSTTKSLQRKVKTRFKSPEFRNEHRAALERVKDSAFCLAGSWFTLGWFVKNDDNWVKCAEGNYDNKKGNGTTTEPVGLAAFDQFEHLLSDVPQEEFIDVAYTQR